MKDKSAKSPSVKRGLVIGCGGVLGGAWSIAALGNLQETLQWDPREAKVLVGTSSGAVLSALLGAGVSVERMQASQLGEAQDCAWDHDTATGGWLPPLPKLQFPGLPLLRAGLRGSISPFTAALGLLPQGNADMRPFVQLIDSVVPAGKWAPHPATWIMAIDAMTGQRVAFGAPQSPKAALSDAVCASYAVPGWCPSVEIEGRHYLDGGMASPTSADFVSDLGLDEVFILAPMTSTDMDTPRSPLMRLERQARRLMTRILDREVRQLQAAGIRVIRIEPGAEDLAAMGYNLMDHRRRRHVFETARHTTAAVLQQQLNA